MPVERGKALNQDDQIRQWVINSLMCQFKVDKQQFFNKFGHDFVDYFLEEAKHLHDCVEDGLIHDNSQRNSSHRFGEDFYP